MRSDLCRNFRGQKIQRGTGEEPGPTDNTYKAEYVVSTGGRVLPAFVLALDIRYCSGRIKRGRREGRGREPMGD